MEARGDRLIDHVRNVDIESALVSDVDEYSTFTPGPERRAPQEHISVIEESGLDRQGSGDCRAQNGPHPVAGIDVADRCRQHSSTFGESTLDRAHDTTRIQLGDLLSGDQKPRFVDAQQTRHPGCHVTDRQQTWNALTWSLGDQCRRRAEVDANGLAPHCRQVPAPSTPLCFLTRP